ncbi:unnamed protein product [Ixodes pacificus]
MRLPLWHVALSLLIISVTARTKINWMTFMRCVDNNYSMIFSIDAMCVVLMMYAQYRIMQKANCPNCERFFHCRANYVPSKWCRSTPKALQVIKTVSSCQDLAKDLNLREKREDEEARKAGRAKMDCAALYLSRAGCRYDPTTGRCLLASPPSRTNGSSKGLPKDTARPRVPATRKVPGGPATAVGPE